MSIRNPFDINNLQTNLEVSLQPISVSILPNTNFLSINKDSLQILQLELQTQSIKYKTEILELQKQLFSKSQQISELQSKKSNISDAYKLNKLNKKKQKIQILKQELSQQSQQFSSDLKILQQKYQKDLQDLCQKYQADTTILSKQNNALKLELESKKKSLKSEVLKTVSEILSSEKKKFLKKISKISASKNEANAKLEILREELKTVNEFIQDFNREEALKSMDSIIAVIQNLSSGSEDFEWVISSLCQIREDFDKCQMVLRLHNRVIAQKNQEIQDLKIRTGLPRIIKCSPGSSKLQTTSCSPTSALNSSFFRNFSPKHIPSYSFQEDTKKNVLSEGLISEFAGLKLKYALLQEYIITRDNDFRIIVYELKKNPEELNKFIDLICKKLDETQNYLD